jgi:glycine cleavage system aminomethyltransferase T/glycine/D-amino acid oxidase-like deaminating enzyme
MENMSIPERAEIVVLGGGIVGCSVAYHLTLLGRRDVVVLEQNELGSGTTWHAAGMVGRLRTSNSLTEINRYSAELYSTLEEVTGHSIGWKQVGSLIVGQTEDRMVQLRRTVAMARYFGIEAGMISASEAKEKWPVMESADLKGAAWLPHDGKVIPGEVPKALAKGATKNGAKVLEGVRATRLIIRKGRVEGVETESGTIQCSQVVLAGGMWSRQFGLAHGINLPLWPVEHHYVVTDPMEGVFDELPLGRDPDGAIYFRGEGKGIMLGAFQKDSKPWDVKTIPSDFSFQLFDPDWKRYEAPLAAGRKRIPSMEKVGFEKFVNGPESFTPDNNFLLGETPEVDGVFVAAGFNSVGIASAGGAGKCLASWMVEGKPPMDLWSVDIRRFGKWANNSEFLKGRVREVLGMHYRMAWPNLEYVTGRGIRRSPLHDRLASMGASFGVKSGWERPNWFAGLGNSAEVEYSFGRQNWFENHGREHRAAREGVALFDQSGFGKLLVCGKDAVRLLQRLCTNNVDVPIGKIVYTGMLNEQGGYESDLTVVRQGEDEFYLVTGTAQTLRDAHWIRKGIFQDEHVVVSDVTALNGVLGVMGPQSRDFLQGFCDANLSNDAFPFGVSREISVGSAVVRALRVTYVGELGWEFHIAADQMANFYDRLLDVGAGQGVQLSGHYAINSLRLEKAYRAWGAELSPDDHPIEAGLSFAVDWKKGDFIGRDALAKIKTSPRARRLVQFVASDPDPVLWGNEPIYRDDQIVGYTTSAAYGHTLGGSVAMGYVSDPDQSYKGDWCDGEYEVENNGERLMVKPYLRSAYDPDRVRIMG